MALVLTAGVDAATAKTKMLSYESAFAKISAQEIERREAAIVREPFPLPPLSSHAADFPRAGRTRLIGPRRDVAAIFLLPYVQVHDRWHQGPLQMHTRCASHRRCCRPGAPLAT